jgi:hypothetical protein
MIRRIARLPMPRNTNGRATNNTSIATASFPVFQNESNCLGQACTSFILGFALPVGSGDHGTVGCVPFGIAPKYGQ